MSKSRIKRRPISTQQIRSRIRFYYMEKFFNKWMNKYEFEGLNYQQSHYLMKKMWAMGTVAISSIKSADEGLAGLLIDGAVDMGENAIIITPWTFANRYNIYDFPTHVNLINTRGVKFITPRILEVDKEVVIGWAQKNHKSVYSSIEAKVEELIDIEMKKRVARKSQSQPWMFAFAPEDVDQADILQQAFDEDVPYMFVPFKEVDHVKGITSGAPYIVDKFEQDRQKIENDILTMLGVNNVGIGEKKEHLIVDEVNANNQDIEEQSESFKKELDEFFARVESVLGYKITIKEKEIKEIEETEQVEDDEYERPLS